MLLHLSYLEMGGMRVLTASQINFFQKSCLTFKGHQHQNQKPSLRINFLPRKFSVALQNLKIDIYLKLRALILSAITNVAFN